MSLPRQPGVVRVGAKRWTRGLGVASAALGARRPRPPGSPARSQVDKFPVGSRMNRSLSMRTGQCHVQRYMGDLLERIERKEIAPTRVITHILPLTDAPRGFHIFEHKLENCEKVVLKP